MQAFKWVRLPKKKIVLGFCYLKSDKTVLFAIVLVKLGSKAVFCKAFIGKK